MNEQFTLLLYLIGILFITPLSLQDGLTWRNLDIVDIEKNNTGIKQFEGKDLCKGDQSECLVTFHNYIEEHWFLKKVAVRAECDKDDSLNGTVVCWIRRKMSNGFPTYQMQTHYQLQFWTDKNGSHLRDNYPRGR